MGKDSHIKRDRRLQRKFQQAADREEVELSHLREQMYDEAMPTEIYQSASERIVQRALEIKLVPYE